MDLDRRELLRTGALGAGAVLLGGGGLGALGRLASGAEAAAAVPNVLSGGLIPEVVTVTERAFQAWWLTDTPQDTTVVLRAPGKAPETRVLERDKLVHVATVDGLQPGTRYRYELRSGGRTIPTTLLHTGTVTTLTPPPGRLLATVALMNDLHIGEGCSGTIQTIAGQSFPPCNSGDRYAIRMTSAAIRALRTVRPKVDFVFANGDITAEARPGEMKTVFGILRRARIPFDVTRGNHDRRHRDSCLAGDNDCFREYAAPNSPLGEHAYHWARDIAPGVTAIGLDSCDPETGNGRLDRGGQLEFLEAELRRTAAAGRRVLLGFHHPVTLYQELTVLPPVLFGVSPILGGQDALDVIARHDHVSLVVHGHTHRNYVGYDGRSGYRTPFLENGAVKEYPGGFGLLRFYEGGVLRTFHRVAEPWCRDWIATTATQLFGRHPDYTRGPLSARAFTHRYDGKGFQPPASTVPGAPDLPFVGS
ncbi:3',5'-cyclic adenosine monophosphate phosphodiesterase CpdA [Paraconexibacter sp. AEG42_29]|uniref:3',5'-cyclic adenosine monophosphate phosphodiesterase CpdA n=1 Tax=Paraconexibacter sp. AEG42_29 TaxID=2997339 RepID=A0AAU7ARC4_9ACTN